jgi:hypothetical protein
MSHKRWSACKKFEITFRKGSIIDLLQSPHSILPFWRNSIIPITYVCLSRITSFSSLTDTSVIWFSFFRSKKENTAEGERYIYITWVSHRNTLIDWSSILQKTSNFIYNLCCEFKKFLCFSHYLLDKYLKRSIITSIPNPRPPLGRALPPHLCHSIASAYHKKVKIPLILGRKNAKTHVFVNFYLSFI